LRFPTLAIEKARKDGARSFDVGSGTAFIAAATRSASHSAQNEWGTQLLWDEWLWGYGDCGLAGKSVAYVLTQPVYEAVVDSGRGIQQNDGGVISLWIEEYV
jgi:hypothetical protein